MTTSLCDGSPSIRQQQLTRHVHTLDRRLARLEQINQRFSLVRLAAFIVGIVAIVLAAAYLPETIAWGVVIAATLIFSLVVGLHRRLDGWRERFAIWRGLRAAQLARLELDWPQIPLPPAPPAPSERVALDIDLDLTGPRSLHHLLDLAVSLEGSQRLAGWLTSGAPEPDQIRARQALAQELARLPRFRDRLLLNLRRVSNEPLHGARLLDWLNVETSAAALRRKLWIGAGMTALNALLFGLDRLAGWPPLWVFSLSIYLIFYFGTRLSELLDAVVRMDTEMDKFRALLLHLETYPLPASPHLEALCRPFRTPGALPSTQLKRLKRITAGVGLRMNPVMGVLLNMVAPWDLWFAYQAARLQQRMTEILPAWLETWYELEALISLANFAWLNPAYTWAEIGGDRWPVFEAVGMGHPLILEVRRVCNDFAIPSLGQVELITGSNMAGKSTFIKTAGVNLCLAYAGGPVCAARLWAQPFRLHTCIRITDSISDGFSYFYAEVKCLRRLLDALRSDDPRPVLYLVDEIFRGTNNRERLIGSRAYIQALAGAHGCGLIATHDLELAGLAESSPAIHNFHFRDTVQDGRLVFDYQIRPGPSPTTNALKIMALEGLPVREEDLNPNTPGAKETSPQRREARAGS